MASIKQRLKGEGVIVAGNLISCGIDAGEKIIGMR